MVTLKHISNITGYSVSTVSKALNDGIDVSIETKKYIQDVAVKNNYTPNKAAISLRKCKSNIIAVLLPKVNDTLYSELLFSIQNAAYKFGYRIMLYQSLDNIEKEKEFLKDISDGSIEAAVVISSNINIIENADNIPVEFFQITKNGNKEELKKKCENNVNELLKLIA